MTVTRLTQRFVSDLLAAESPGRDLYFWDERAPGFGCRRKARSKSTAFVLQWRDSGTGKPHRIVLADAAKLSLDDARQLAKQRWREIADGSNPLADKRQRREAPAFAEWLDACYLTSDVWKRKAATTQSYDKGKIEAFLKPALGGKKLADITTAEINRLARDLADPEKAQALAKRAGRTKKTRRGGEGGARRTMRLVKAIFAYAVDTGDLEVSPATKIKIGADGQRDAVPDEAAYGRLWEALTKLRAEGGSLAKACDAVLLIAMTGARRNEIGRLRARHVSLVERRILLPANEHKGGRKSGKSRIIALPDEAVALLSAYAPTENDADADAFVFAGLTGRPVAIQRYWNQIAAEAKLDPMVTMHSLRHGIGTALAAAGMTPVQIAQQLGHAGWAVSQRYVHAVDKARQDLAQKAADLVRPARLRAVN